MKKQKKFGPSITTKNLVGSGIMLATGATAMSAMGQDKMAGQIIGPAANMMGPMATAGYGMEVVKMFSNTKKNKGGF